MRYAPTAGLNIDADHPRLNHSLLSGLVPDGEPPSGAKDWSRRPMSAAAAPAGALRDSTTTTLTVATARRVCRRRAVLGSARRPTRLAAVVIAAGLRGSCVRSRAGRRGDRRG